MAKFAEIDSGNVVLRVVQACNDDVDNNGGEQSAQAASHFEKTIPLNPMGVKWVQTSFSGSFRKKLAHPGDVYNESLDMFVEAQPYSNFTLNSEGDWISPVGTPEDLDASGNFIARIWDEANQKWVANCSTPSDLSTATLEWNPSTSTWDAV